MPKAVELLRQGRNEELWQMCCGFLNLSLNEFMAIQKRLLLEQMELLYRSQLGKKIMRGHKPETIEEFRQQVPLTAYADYCPELLEKKEDVLPVKPVMWVRTSGRSGEYPCRWIPVTPAGSHELSVLSYGIAMISSSKCWGDSSQFPELPRVFYTVAPPPYMSGAMAHFMEQQTPLNHMPALKQAEGMSYQDRIKLGFKQALSEGIDYFFGLSLVLAAVGDKLNQSSAKANIRQLLTRPKAMIRLTRGIIRSKIAGRQMLPRDLWSVKGIISGGLDSWVYRDKIKQLWGRYPLDVYATTEGAVIATQLWDYESMTFVPNLNFLEFMPEEEHFKWQMDRSYQPRTVLLDEVRPGENYELIITNFHGGPLVRYRIGDMIKITSMQNEKVGVALPQMVFERRADGLINFVVVQLTEKLVWQAIEKTGIAYEDWTAYKIPGESVLRVLIELKNGFQGDGPGIAAAIREQILKSGDGNNGMSGVLEDLTDMVDFNVEVALLPFGAFANYMAQKQAEGVDLAHLKPPHLNPSDQVLSLLLGEREEVIVVSKTRSEAEIETKTEKIPS
ncbi:MAG: hypothetical protein A2144_05970 [Chloroflexi bacterium RBG_16_50_9]|nr:MAG: hypothetical protein A2144_05970 [Chloroflexi bacterium RBG_16_50_9]